MRRAHRAVARAVKAGELVPDELCANCGRGFATGLHAHHPCGYDFENQLVVIWLCPRCHKWEHSPISVLVALDVDQLAWLDAAAEARGIDRAECLRRLVAAHHKADTDVKPSVHSIVEASSACSGFRPSKGNALRCLCGRRKADHR
jgi:hypothetical protein